MSKHRILILEDDESLLSALAKAFERAGHKVFTARKPDVARATLRSDDINWLFVDCLLPQMAGADFVKEIRAQHPPEQLAVVFMSGVFTDKKFVDDAVEKTKAIRFLQKPFDIKDALALFPQDEEKAELSPRQELYALLARPNTTPRDQRKALERVEQIHGFDLPYIYSMLVAGGTSGHLNIIDSETGISGITFREGAIVGVDVPDKETLIGNLFIEAGYLTQTELDKVLEVKVPKKIGQRLIQENLLSPHAFDEILAQQMNIRLSRTVVHRLIRVNFVEAEVEDAPVSIDSEAFLPFLHDWVASKLTESWLENHYRSWGDNSLKPKKSLSPENPVFATPLLKKMPQLINLLSGGKTINQILEMADVDSTIMFKALHLLFISGSICLSEQSSEQDQEKRFARLKNLAGTLTEKNYFEIYEMMGGQRALILEELEGVYHDFLKILGPEPDVARYPDGHKAWTLLFTRANETRALFADQDKLVQYQQSLEQGDMEKKFFAQRKFEEAQAQLRISQYQRALSILEEVERISPEKEGLRLHILWAKLGRFDSHPDPKTLRKSIEKDYLQIPPEEKHLALSVFISGLYNKMLGDQTAAKREFERAASMDSALVQARRELHLMTIQQQQKPKDFLKRDLKELVGSLFKRKDSA